MWEFTSGFPPFDDIEHGFQLSLNICGGKRPKIIENAPQCYVDLMKKCWDEDPLKRPDALKISNIIKNWYENISNRNINKESKNIVKEFYEADKSLEQKQTNVLISKTHPREYHTSRLLDFTKQLNEILIQKDNAQAEYSGMFIF